MPYVRRRLVDGPTVGSTMQEPVRTFKSLVKKPTGNGTAFRLPAGVKRRPAAKVKPRVNRRGGYGSTSRGTAWSVGSSIPRGVSLSTALNYMDPTGKVEPPLSTDSLGNFVTLTSLRRGSITPSSSNGGYFVIVQPTMSSSYRVMIVPRTGSPIVAFEHLNTLYADSPSSVKPLRAAMKLRNSTIMTSLTGTIRTLMLSVGLTWEFTNTTDHILTGTMMTSLESMINENPRVTTYLASQMSVKEHLFVLPPASHSAYNTYQAFFNPTTSLELHNDLVLGAEKMAFSTLIIAIDEPSVANDYSWTYIEQTALRYPANTILNALSKPPPVGDAAWIKKVHDAVGQHGGKAADTNGGSG